VPLALVFTMAFIVKFYMEWLDIAKANQIYFYVVEDTNSV
jgi:hypothetical protein